MAGSEPFDLTLDESSEEELVYMGTSKLGDVQSPSPLKVELEDSEDSQESGTSSSSESEDDVKMDRR